MAYHYAQLNASACFGAAEGARVAFHRQQRADLNHIYKLYHGWVQLPFALLGFVCAAAYSAACLRAIRQRRVSRKSYVLLLSRSVADLLTCVVSFALFAYVQLTPQPNEDYAQAFDSLLMGFFWSGVTSYVALSMLKLYAVARPLAYRHHMSMRKCVGLILVSWLVMALMFSAAVSASAFSKVSPLRQWSGCRVETCQRYFYQVRNTAVVVVYVATLVCFGMTVLIIRRHRRFASIHAKRSTETRASTRVKLRDRFPLWKLAVNIATFAVANLCYVVWAMSRLVVTDRCFFVRHFNTMIFLLSFVHLSIMIRIIVDPVLALFTDKPIRESMLHILGLQRYLKNTSKLDEDNSSESRSTTLTNFTGRPLPDRAIVSTSNL